MLVKYQGKDVEVAEIEAVSAHEPWSEYQLSDGTILSVKNVLVQVYKAKTVTVDSGDPLYITNNMTVVKTRMAK